MTYAEKLRDPRWTAKREEVLKLNEYECLNCGTTADYARLEVHHPYYLRNREPWEYGTDELMCLCSACHKDRQAIEEMARLEVSIMMSRWFSSQIVGYTEKLREINGQFKTPRPKEYDAWAELL